MSVRRNVLVIGHRGAAGHTLENSRASFAKALALGVDMVELDVIACKTGELIVMHDRTLDRTTNGSGYIQEQTHAQLQQWQLLNGEPVSTLAEVLLFINQRTRVNIELKSNNTALETARIIQQFVHDYQWLPHDFLVTSFDHQELALFHQACSIIPIGILVDGILVDMCDYATRLGAHIIVLSYEYVTTQLVDYLHMHNQKVFVYTVNDPVDIVAMQQCGVDGIITDYPDRVSSML